LLREASGQIERGSLALADDHVAFDRELPLKRALGFWGGPVDEAMEALGIAHLANVPAYAGLGTIGFAKPIAARHWLQASNPSERWKWDFMFQEVNTQKWDGLNAALPQLNIIPLTPVQESKPEGR